MKKVYSIVLIILIGGFVLFYNSCSSGKERDDAFDILEDTAISEEMEFEDEEIVGMISSVPNPVEMSVLLQRSDVVFSQELMNPVNNIDNYNSGFKKALNLGVYGTNLVHMNIYDRSVATVRYLQNVRNLAEDLRIGHFFDYETLNRLSEQSRNVDSVLYITNRSFDEMTRYLIEENRSSLAVLIASGTWIESIYIATNVETFPENKEIIYERIGEQKVVLDNLMLLISNFRDDQQFDELFLDLMKLKKEFDKVNIEYIHKDPIMKEVDGRIVVVDKSTSKVNIDDEIVRGISDKVNYIRNKIIQ